jgi:hypothetical protein
MVNLSNFVSSKIRSKFSFKSTKLKYSWWLGYIISRSRMGNIFYTRVVSISKRPWAGKYLFFSNYF